MMENNNNNINNYVLNPLNSCRTEGFNNNNINNNKLTMKDRLLLSDAADYFNNKLHNSNSNNNSRYSHCLAALYNEINENNKAEVFYKHAIAHNPSNIMIRNDYALYLSKLGYTHDATDELHKAMLTNEDQPTLRKNMGAVLARSGELLMAEKHTKRALELNNNDAMAHRNYARIKDALGDSNLALKHNKIAIEIETKHNNINNLGNCSAHRAAAVQIITRGGNHSEALELMRVARELEHKELVLSTSQGTKEVLAMIVKRSGLYYYYLFIFNLFYFIYVIITVHKYVIINNNR